MFKKIVITSALVITSLSASMVNGSASASAFKSNEETSLKSNSDYVLALSKKLSLGTEFNGSMSYATFLTGSARVGEGNTGVVQLLSADGEVLTTVDSKEFIPGGIIFSANGIHTIKRATQVSLTIYDKNSTKLSTLTEKLNLN